MKVVDISRSFALDMLRERCHRVNLAALPLRATRLFRVSIQLDCQRSIDCWRCFLNPAAPASPLKAVQVFTPKVVGPLHRRLKYTSFGVLPPNVMWGLWSLNQSW